MISKTLISAKLCAAIALLLSHNASSREKKPWTFIVYTAADNSLRDFAARNMKQMSAVGSNNNINILVHLDIRLLGSKKITRRYFIEKNNPVQLEMTEKTPMNSGDPQTLISACKWAIEEYPAEHYMLILWDHGTGIIDPYSRRHIDTRTLFSYNAEANIYELDRTIGYLELLELINDPKGICWDDSSGDYLTNQKFEFALNEITSRILKNKKFDIIAFDACLMSMIEIANLTKNYADIQVSSQEVEPGPGYRYDEVLAPFLFGAPSPRDFAAHVVDSFAKAYKPSGNHSGFVDFTQSALDLNHINELEQNIDQLGSLFSTALQSAEAGLFKNIISASRNKKHCTHFNEPSYIDLHHFYSNLLNKLTSANTAHSSLVQQANNIVQEGIKLINNAIINNVSGSNLPHAKGISIYFPERKIHTSYKKTNFAKNRWVKFLSDYLLS